MEGLDPFTGFHQTRWFKVASHNATDAVEQGVVSASNYTVILGDDLPRVGELAGISLEQISFVNNFPNVTAPNNEILFRTSVPATDTWAPPLTVLSFSFGGDSGSVTYPGTAVGTPAVVAELNSLFPLPVFSYDGYGAIILNPPVTVTLDSASWSTTFGVSADQLGKEARYFLLYPLSIYGGMFFQVLVPPGLFYNQNQLGIIVTDAMTSLVGGVFTINPVVGAPDQRYLFRVVSGPPVMFVVRGDLPFQHTDYRQLLYQMGLSDNYPTVLYTVLQFDLNPALQGEQVIYLWSNLLAANNRSFDGEGAPGSLIATIPVNVIYGGVVNYTLNQYAAPSLVFQHPVPKRQFDFTLKNIYDELLDIGWNQNLTVTLRLWFRGT